MINVWIAIILILLPFTSSREKGLEFIHNGDIARRHVAPYQVSIQVMQWPFTLESKLNAEHTCGGALIRPYAVLTAAHCLYLPSPFLVVKAGMLVMNENHPDVQISLLRHYKIHKGYDKSNNGGQSSANDIGILILETAFTQTAAVKPMDIPNTCTADNNGLATVAGWGYVSDTEKRAATFLRIAEVPVLPFSKCQRDLNRFISVQILPSQMCTKTAFGFGKPCGGDSGGAAVQHHQVVGLVSFGCSSCNLEQCPTVYTRVCSFRDFIIDYLDSFQFPSRSQKG